MFGAQQGMEAGISERLLSIRPVVATDISEQQLNTGFWVLIRHLWSDFWASRALSPRVLLRSGS